jgi:rare lipoprotein A
MSAHSFRKEYRRMKSILVWAPMLAVVCATYMPAAQRSSAGTSSDAKTVTASYYSGTYNGRRTASMERFSNGGLTAAHRELPFGTRVKLTNPANSRSVVVRVNDRGPFVDGREISVTRRAARQLGFVRSGLAPVSMAVLPSGK